ncbi:division/outer membrane stress-associated lipid-binding lipoprotein [Orbus sturtevantii]|uniref:division/outer membrane stress-associated lipid-binding lipoprotein n=1 Tax=Orbus sturtevantii TaxID=3074109 RepID=UPI00370D1EC7
MKKVVLIAMVITGSLILQGCVAAFLGAGAGVAKVATDPRTTGTQVDDTTLDSRISVRLKDESDYFKGSRIVASAYDGNVLLIGQAKSQAVIDRAFELVQSVDGVKKIYNKIQVGKIISAGAMTDDAWITTKVKSSLIANKQTKARDIKVITEDGQVFLIGMVTAEDGRLAADIASKVSGVKLVTTIFTYIN